MLALVAVIRNIYKVRKKEANSCGTRELQEMFLYVMFVTLVYILILWSIDNSVSHGRCHVYAKYENTTSCVTRKVLENV